MSSPLAHAPSSPAPAQDEPATPVDRGWWARFAQRHLFDYNAAATRLWLLIALLGAVAAAFSVLKLVSLPGPELAEVAIGSVLVVLAACVPVHIPRTKYSIGVADVFVFMLLALHGAPAAALAAGAEGLVGALRTSRRLTSRVSTPATATFAMLLSGLGFEALHGVLVQAGWPTASSGLAALCLVAVPYFAGITLPLLAVVAAKNGVRVSLRDWAQNYAWFFAIVLFSAMVAGILAMNVRQFGPTVITVTAAAAAAVVASVRASLRRHEAEHEAQEARIKTAQRAAEINQLRFTASFVHAAIGMAIVRTDGCIHQVNQALCALLGSDERALLGRRFDELLHPGDAELFRRRTSGDASEAVAIELRCCGASGEVIWVSLHCGRYIDPADDRSGLIYQLHDITSRRLAERELQHIAYHDSLTDLANRNCFNERLAVAVERSRIDANCRFVVMFLDLDHFKMVNDSLGHVAGNTLLCAVARRLADGVRPNDLVARLGGDEFAVLLEHVLDLDDALLLAQRLLQTVSAPLLINGTEVLPGASIGITFSDLGYRTTDEVLRDADLAMYAAKGNGRQRVALFEASMHERIAEKVALESDLRRAIGDGQLSLVYQPLFELQPYRLSGFEALARWDHPERGSISPEVFVALAEESGRIEALTHWVIDQAVAQMTKWCADHVQLAQVDMHVNISGRDLTNPGLVPHVQEVLRRHGLAARQLTLEVTETTLMGKLSVALDALQALRKVGIKVSIDDFGTGYSSLAYLSTLPIDSLKIDRSFVMSMDAQPQNVEIVRAVFNLGRSLGKKVIAEGIETAPQLATLKEIGVHAGQGYLLSRPLRPEQVLPLIEMTAIVV